MLALLLSACMTVPASAFAPAVGLPMPKAMRLGRSAVARSAHELRMQEERPSFEIVDGVPFKLGIAPIGAFSFAGWVGPSTPKQLT